MRIAQLAPLIESVPPTGYGGIELVVSLLTEQLVTRGHEVTLFASGDSRTSARLVSVVDRGLRKAMPGKQYLWSAFDSQSLLELGRLSDHFDIVHNHMGWQALPWIAKLGLPSLTTNHNLIEEAVAPLYLAHGHLPYASISEAYRRLNYPDSLNYVSTVYNGIAVKRYEYDRHSNRPYLCFLGRLCFDKGTVHAIEIAKRLKMPLKIAGKVDPSDRDYFAEHIEPLMDDPLIDYVGELDHRGKVELFRHAYAIVYPVCFEEPFGLVMAEALACGVPVLAFDRGAVREVLTDGETAVVAQSAEEIVERFSEIAHIERAACRQRVETLFSAARMADRYEQLYEKLTASTSSAVTHAAQVAEPTSTMSA